MNIKKLPLNDGKHNFNGVDIMTLYASEREFAAIVGASKTQIHKLKLYGVLDNVHLSSGLNLYRNLRSYRQYLQPTERSEFDERLRLNGYDVFIEDAAD